MLTLIHTGLLHIDSDDKSRSASLEIRHQWIAIVAGCTAAALAAWLLAPVCLLLQPSPFVIISASCLFLAVTSAAGSLGTWIAQLALDTEAPCKATQISRRALAAWIFFPSVAFLCQRRAPTALLAAAIASIVLTLRLRPIFAPTEEPKIVPAAPRLMPSLYGLPAADSNPSQAAFIAICAIGALACAFNFLLFSSALLLAISLALPLWRWSAFSSTLVDAFGKRRVLYPLAALAIIFTILSVAPSSFPDGFWPFRGVAHHSLYAAHSPGNRKGVDRDYVSIILLPPPVKKTRIIPPPPDSGPGFASAKYVVIPFDGSYWYFQPPAVGPGAHAYLAHGKATAADIRSTNLYSLAMEAHQKLDVPIDLSCCRAIDLAITNADTRPGPIALSMQIQDSSDKTAAPFNLGSMTVPSSAGSIHLNREPVRETIRFFIPPSKTLGRFDRISVIYLPSGVRSHVGAKVSVDSFTLVPR